MIKISVIFVMALGCSDALAGDVSLYSCTEQKSVGWEKKDDGNVYVGQFHPDTKTFMVRFLSADTSQYKSTKHLTLPRIEISASDGGTTQLVSDVCNGYGPMAIETGIQPSEFCKTVIDTEHTSWQESFGNERIWFSRHLSARPSFVIYTKSNVFLDSNSYLSEGTCGLVN